MSYYPPHHPPRQDWIWIIVLILLFSGGRGFGQDNLWLIILLLLFFQGGFVGFPFGGLLGASEEQ